jgi:hypothetical protein
MHTTRLAALAAVLTVGVSVPALADWDRIGTIDVSRGRDRDVRNFDLGGSVEGLRLQADRSDVYCRSVNATFGNGRTRNVFSGNLRQGSMTDVNLPGGDRNVTRLAFNCSSDRGGASVRIFADVGRYRQEWMRSPNWGALWAHTFNWGSNAINNWVYAGDAKFVGRNDSDSTFTGWRGRNSDAIALKPIGASARCSRVTATFQNGRTQNLALHNGDVLQQGEFNSLDLPGGYRNVTSLYMKCRATDARAVTIQIYTSK